MRWNKANFAGLTSPGQQSEMKSILAGTWPPLKPLPVFKYETAEYRATIDFDKKRGEWVCRKISLPSNEVQELRGGLAEITMAMPHGEAEIFIEGVEQQEPEFERETNRRLQAIREWREKYENGARYFELRDLLSERQRSELDDSLRLSLTARQLQFNPRNAADVFDDLTVAGGRFAALIEFAKRKKANPGADSQVQAEAAAPEAECEADTSRSAGIGSHAFEGVVNNVANNNNNDAFVLSQQAEECSASADQFPALSIKDVFPEQEQSPFAERMAHATPQQFEFETAEIVDASSASLVEDPQLERHFEKHGVPAFPDVAARVPTDAPFADRIHGSFSVDHVKGSSSRFPALKISAFQVNVFAILLLFAVTSFSVGLTVGRGPLGKRLREPPISLIAREATPPTRPEPTDESTSQSDESTPQTAPQPASSSVDSAGANKPGDVDAAPSEENSTAGTPTTVVPRRESTGGSDSAEARSGDLSPTIEPKPSAKPEVNSKRGGAIRLVERNVSPPGRSNLVRPPRAAKPMSRAPRNRVPYRLTSTISAAPRAPRASTVVLVTVPAHGSQPFRVNFPEKTIAATSSLAMTSQLSVLVLPEPEAPVAHESARLEAGELVSFGWPRYAMAGGRYGSAETIRVRVTIGQLGQVEEIKFLSGSASLLPATSESIRQWRYRPTLLDKRPVPAQQDITIEYRPPQYSSQLSTRHSSHN